MNLFAFRYRLVATLALLFAGCSLLQAALYYVDFDGGLDSNPGTSTGSAWKHCPGDPNATGNAAAALLNPGDTVKFKGGAIYRGSIVLTRSGSDGSPLTYDGNSAGDWGTGQAILDGSAVFTTAWTQCANSADCGGNANFANIYYTTLPSGVTNGWPQLLYDGNNQTHTAQHPNPTRRVLFDVVTEWTLMTTNQVTTNSVTDTAYFTQSSSTFWNEAWVGIWISGNLTVFRSVTNFNTSTDTVRFSPSSVPYSNRDSYYAMFNHPSLIDQPGEHCMSTNENRLYLWPPGSVHPTNYTWSVGSRANAFAGSSRHHITIKNFLIQGYFSTISAGGYTGTAISLAPSEYDGNECRNNIFQDNTVRFLKNMDREWLVTMNNGNNVTVIRNSVTNCFGGGVYAGGTNMLISSNLFQTLSGTAVYMPGSVNSSITWNRVIDINGTHANGISVYSHSTNTTISYNIISNCPSLLTYENSHNFTFVGNLINAAGSDQRINDWGALTGDIYWLGNTMVNNSADRIWHSATDFNTNVTRWYITNNIIDGGGGGGTQSYRGNNIYVGLHYWQGARYGWFLSGGESVSTDSAVFANSAAGNFLLKSGSPALDAGVAASAYYNSDLLGVNRPQGNAFDVGAFEYRFKQGANPASPLGLKLVFPSGAPVGIRSGN